MLGQEMEQHLKEVIIPFWKKLRDDEYGGYYGYVDYDLHTDKKAVKGCILNSRITWFFANAAKLLGEEGLLDEARHGYEYMKQHCIDQAWGGVFWSTGYDGSPEDTAKHTYNQAFAIYALASYYDVSQEKEALELAWKLFWLVENKCRDDVGYLEAFDRQFRPVENDKLSENGVIAEKTMNTLLHVFEAYTELYRVTGDRYVAERLKWILDTFAESVYNPELHRQEVFFDKNMNSIIDLHSYGHDIETAWLIDRGIDILKEETYRQKLAPITADLEAQIYKSAFDGHSLHNECERGKVDTHRVWWVQAEAVVGFYNAWQKQPEHTEYLQAAEAVWEYIKEHMTDKREGSEWFWEADPEGIPFPGRPIVEPWKCPYHNGRMCMEIIRRENLRYAGGKEYGA